MSEWEKVKLGDYCKTNMHSYSTNDNCLFVNYLDTGNITENSINEVLFLDLLNTKLPSRARRKVLNGDIIYSTVRPNQRHYGIIKEQPINFLVSTGFTTLSTKQDELYNYFLYYYLIQKEVTDYLQSIAEQSVSTYPSIKASHLEDLEIPLPPLKEQKRIAKILSSLDDKIENNNAINKNLEEQAQAIFKSWFIDFEPFGGLMPSDWREGTLGDVAGIVMGQSPTGSSYNEEKNGVVFYQGRAEFGWRFPIQRLFTTEPKRLAQKDDILMSVRAPVGDINIAYEDCCIGRGLSGLRSKCDSQSFLLYLMKSLHETFQMYNGTGTVFGSINKDSLHNIKIVIPTAENINKFEEIVSSFDKQILNNTKEIRNLSQLRDTLLPRLMNGELSSY